MSALRDDQVRRLLAHLRRQITDAKQLAEIEDMLGSDEAEEFLREPELLHYFPALSEEFLLESVTWRLRIIPHAHLRIVQRGLSVHSVVQMFRRFLKFNAGQDVLITPGAYTVTGRPAPRERLVTLRIDVSEVAEDEGKAHIVTVIIGRTYAIDEVGASDIS